MGRGAAGQAAGGAGCDICAPIRAEQGGAGVHSGDIPHCEEEGYREVWKLQDEGEYIGVLCAVRK